MASGQAAGLTREDLEQGGPTRVARARGSGGSPGPRPRLPGGEPQRHGLGRIDGDLGGAVGAGLAHEPLGHDPHQGGGQEEGLHLHVDQPPDGAGRVVGVKRGEHQMPGERRLDRHLRRLGVADFAHHDDVGVLAQQRAQRAARR